MYQKSKKQVMPKLHQGPNGGWFYWKTVGGQRKKVRVSKDFVRKVKQSKSRGRRNRFGNEEQEEAHQEVDRSILGVAVESANDAWAVFVHDPQNFFKHGVDVRCFLSRIKFGVDPMLRVFTVGESARTVEFQQIEADCFEATTRAYKASSMVDKILEPDGADFIKSIILATWERVTGDIMEEEMLKKYMEEYVKKTLRILSEIKNESETNPVILGPDGTRRRLTNLEIFINTVTDSVEPRFAEFAQIWNDARNGFRNPGDPEINEDIISRAFGIFMPMYIASLFQVMMDTVRSKKNIEKWLDGDFTDSLDLIDPFIGNIVIPAD